MHSRTHSVYIVDSFRLTMNGKTSSIVHYNYVFFLWPNNEVFYEEKKNSQKENEIILSSIIVIIQQQHSHYGYYYRKKDKERNMIRKPNDGEKNNQT